MKHSTPPPDVLLLKRKGHKRHHRQANHHIGRWFWCIFTLFVLVGGSYLGAEFYLRHLKSQRTQEDTISNMEVILAALEAYHQANGNYPPAFQKNGRGEKTLSWRVAILPYFLDANGVPRYQDLYDSFNQEEPWNHADNWALLSKMPREYRSPRSRNRSDGENANYSTNYLTIRNPHSVFPETRAPINKSRITDPLADTVVLIEVADDAAVNWTCPDDFVFDPTIRGEASPRSFQPGTLVCGMCDGSVSVLGAGVDVEKLFQTLPPLSSDELEKQNPWVGPFLLNNDSPELPEESSEEAPAHEEYRPGKPVTASTSLESDDESNDESDDESDKKTDEKSDDETDEGVNKEVHKESNEGSMKSPTD